MHEMTVGGLSLPDTSNATEFMVRADGHLDVDLDIKDHFYVEMR